MRYKNNIGGVVKAKRDIEENAELLLYYGPQYWLFNMFGVDVPDEDMPNPDVADGAPANEMICVIELVLSVIARVIV